MNKIKRIPDGNGGHIAVISGEKIMSSIALDKQEYVRVDILFQDEPVAEMITKCKSYKAKCLLVALFCMKHIDEEVDGTIKMTKDKIFVIDEYLPF